MKITIATGLYPPEIGGPATYVKMLETELPTQGFVVSVVPFALVRQYPKLVKHFIYAWKLWRVSKESDIIYALDPVSVGLPALLVSKLRRRPLLIRLGGDYAWEQGRVRFGITDTLDEFWEQTNKRSLIVRFFVRLQFFVVSRAKKVILPSEYLKSIVLQWGVAEEKIKVIYSALSPIEITGTRSELREHFSFRYPALISVGRLVPWKGFVALLEVVSRLKERYPNVSLAIVGDGPERSVLEQKVKDLNLSKQVWFTGQVSREVLGSAVKASDIFILNTAYEGLSHQLLEVMDIGTPIITTKAGGNPELIETGVNGFLVEFNNLNELEETIIRVIDHPESHERMTQSARLRSKKFNKKVAIDEIVKVLKENHYE